MFGLKKRKKPAKRTARSLFHGVAIKPGGNGCCGAAEGLANVRFLADDAPILPLSECTNGTECRCTYEHFDDRRTQLRRDSDVGLPAKDHPNDLRSGTGRRITDG